MKKYKTYVTENKNGTELKYKYTEDGRVNFYRDGEFWGSPSGESFVTQLLYDIEELEKELSKKS